MLKVDDQFSEQFQFTQEEVIQFAKLTGDHNPLHLDSNYASQTIFKKPIMHGFLGGSIFSKVIGTRFPGEGSVYLKQSLEFMRPMYVDELYTAEFTIKEIDTNEGTGLIETIIKNGKGKTAIKGEALVLNKIAFK